jgi:putative ABC transport system ATP-binding protein
MSLSLQDVTYSYTANMLIINGITQEFEQGKVYAIIGPSGCGKTTLLAIMGGLDTPKSGAVLFDGRQIGEKDLQTHRREHVSFIFQNYNLIDYMTPIENVALTAKTPPQQALERVGIAPDEMRRNVLKLSGGQQQRVAIARALASSAPVILADEPTGNIDVDTAKEIIDLLCQAAHIGKCVIIVTHSADIVDRADYTFKLLDGRLKA